MASAKRSPRYPFISIGKALERTDVLYRAESRNATPVSVILEHWGYKEKSSGGNQTLAALRAYGLLETTGSGPSRSLRVTEQARRILLDQREDSTERAVLIREAALEPSIFSELWLKWENAMPSGPSMKHALVFDHNFTEAGADGFIKVFTETVEYARLNEAGKVGENELKSSADSQSGVQTNTEIPTARAPTKLVTPQVEINMQQTTFPLTEGDAVIQWPKSLSPESYEEFESWVQLTLKRAKRSIIVDVSEGGESGESELV